MTKGIDLHIGKRLRRRRRDLGLTQTQFADMVGIRFQQVGNYESAATKISAARLWVFAQALDVPLSYFVEGLDEADASAARSEREPAGAEA